MNKALLGAIALTASVAVAGPAFATAITLTDADIGSPIAYNYNGFDGSGTIDGLTGSTTLTLTGVTNSTYTFGYQVNNTSSDPILTSRISGFGFNTDPTLSGASSTGTYNIVGTDSNVPNIGVVDVCFKGGGGTNSCAGGGGGGVNLGDTGSGSLTLDFGAALSSLDLSNFFVRYQSITGTNANTPGSAVGSVSTSSSTGGTPVPAPGMLGLLAFALLGLGVSRSKKLPKFQARLA